MQQIQLALHKYKQTKQTQAQFYQLVKFYKNQQKCIKKYQKIVDESVAFSVKKTFLGDF